MSEARRERLAALGPFFAVVGHPPGAGSGGGWRPLADLLDVPGLVQARVDGARAALAAAGGRAGRAGTATGGGAVELRVAASAVHLGFMARLVSPLLALAALDGVDRVPALADVRWRDVPGGAVPLSLPEPVLGAPAARDPHWERWVERVLAGPLGDLDRAFAASLPSGHVRRGNLASAVHGAVTVLAASAAVRAAPSPAGGEPAAGVPADRLGQARVLARLLLDGQALRGAASGEPGTAAFRRRSCCLIYRVAGPAGTRAVCGDCVLLPAGRGGGSRDVAG